MRRNYPKAWRYSRFSRYRELGLLIIVVALSTSLVVSNLNKDKYHISRSVSKQLDFPVLFLRNPTPTINLDEQSVKVSKEGGDTKVFSFVVKESDGNVTITEQTFPEVLIYDKLTNSINPYSDIGTSYGKVTMGRPKNGGGKQVGVLKYQDSTLIFIQPTKSLTDDQVKTLINNLELVKQ